MDHLSVCLLGGFAVRRGDEAVDLPPACQRLIALLALERRPVHRLWVCTTLWPQAQTRKAIESLRSAMWRLRPAGADGLLAVDPPYVQLAPEVSVDWRDAVDRIDELLGGDIDPQLVTELLPLLREGDLLDRWAEPWLTAERDRYHALRASAFEALSHSADKPHHKSAPVRAVQAHQRTVSANADADESGES